MRSEASQICRRLGIDDFHYVEIESKKRVVPEEVKSLKNFLTSDRRVHHLKTALFFDQFLDTASMDLFRLGVSLRLRYKREGSKVYLQYKGPGFHKDGVLYRSEFSTARLGHVLMEESHHDIVHFTDTTIQDILGRNLDTNMAKAMRRHLGAKVISKIASGPIITFYQKEKFMVDLGPVFLEPSIDRVFAFHINKVGLHPLSTFCEYENEIKMNWGGPDEKIRRLPKLLEFDERLTRRFDLPSEPLDKYHRCSSFFHPNGSKAKGV